MTPQEQEIRSLKGFKIMDARVYAAEEHEINYPFKDTNERRSASMKVGEIFRYGRFCKPLW